MHDHFHMRSADRRSLKPLLQPETIREICQNSPNPNPVTTLRAEEFYLIPALRYASTPARPTAARANKKLPSAPEEFSEL